MGSAGQRWVAVLAVNVGLVARLCSLYKGSPAVSGASGSGGGWSGWHDCVVEGKPCCPAIATGASGGGGGWSGGFAGWAQSCVCIPAIYSTSERARSKRPDQALDPHSTAIGRTCARAGRGCWAARGCLPLPPCNLQVRATCCNHIRAGEEPINKPIQHHIPSPVKTHLCASEDRMLGCEGSSWSSRPANAA